MRKYTLPVFITLLLFISLGDGQEKADDKRLTFHGDAKARSDEAKNESWPRFLGAHDNGVSAETHLLKNFPENGPKVVWELKKGTGYTSPAVSEDRLFLFHRLEDEEILECRNPSDGKLFWKRGYPVEYQDRYGYNNGPRASPVLDGDFVYTLGVRSILTCWRQKSGETVWKRDLEKDYGATGNFFGFGPTPLVFENQLILNVGGMGKTTEDNVTVAGFDKLTGKTLWKGASPWGASYASPIAAKIHGKDRVFVFAGGQSRPPHGGLLLVDPKAGKILSTFPWRADEYESVNAVTPVVQGNEVFITETYGVGGILLEVTEKDKFQVKWKAPDFGSHWTTPVWHDGYLYGVDGRHSREAELVCYDWKTGEEKWREAPEWKVRWRERDFTTQVFRGSLLRVDGRFLVLGEFGDLLWMDLTPEKAAILDKVRLFYTRETWTLPALSRGLLYVSQHYEELGPGGKPPRLICYDLRS